MRATSNSWSTMSPNEYARVGIASSFGSTSGGLSGQTSPPVGGERSADRMSRARPTECLTHVAAGLGKRNSELDKVNSELGGQKSELAETKSELAEHKSELGD